MAKRGQIRTALDELKEYANSLAPQRGFFSTLDELVQQAPFERGSAEQWRGYLKPGRMLKREGMEFPLKGEEFDYSLKKILEAPKRFSLDRPQPEDPDLMDYLREESIPKEDLLEVMRRERPQFSLKVGSDDAYGQRLDKIERYAEAPYRGENGVNYPKRFDMQGLRWGPENDSYERLWHTGPHGYNRDVAANVEFEESATGLQGLDYRRGHFDRDTLSWSRTSRHNMLKNGENIGPVRLIEEIQSDLHQTARKPAGFPRDFMTDEQRATLEELGKKKEVDRWRLSSRAAILRQANPQLIGNEDGMNALLSGDELYNQFSKAMWDTDLEMKQLEESVDVPARGYQDEDYLDHVRQAQDRANRTGTPAPYPRGFRADAVPDAPFKDPADYGRLELRKNLLDAAKSGDEYLALARGQDQVDRYSLTDKAAAGTKHVYDNVYRGEMEKLAKRYGAEVVEIPLDVGRTFDVRTQTMRDMGAESVHDFVNSAYDGLPKSQFHREIADLIDELDHGQVNKHLVLRAEDGLQRFMDSVARVGEEPGGEQFEADQARRFEQLLADVSELFNSHEQHVMDNTPDQDFDADGQKTFPAIRLTPEVRERIKRVGVPLWSLVGGAATLEALDQDDEDPAMYAKGGQVKRSLQELKELANAVAPQRGMFSTLDELVQGAPFERGSEEQWRGYLKPGRMLKREGMEFPLKQEELDYALDPALSAREGLQAAGIGVGDELTKENLLKYVRDTRPRFGLTIGDDRLTEGMSDVERVVDSGNDNPINQALDRLADMSQPKGMRRIRLTGAGYGPENNPRLSHNSPGSTYQESVTTMQGMDHRQHFDRSGLSHSRASRHQSPETGGVRLVEEIQSDVHEAAAERKPRGGDYMTPEERAEYERLMGETMTDRTAEGNTARLDRTRAILDAAQRRPPPRRGYATDEMWREFEDLHERRDKRSNLTALGAVESPYPTARAAVASRFSNDEQPLTHWGREDEDRYQALRLELKDKVPDAPFKDPADYGRLELRKQLLQAVDDDENYLALTRGEDQIQRYGMDADAAFRRGDPEGEILKKAEGMRFIYDKVYRGEMEKLAKRYGAEVVDVPLRVATDRDYRPQAMQEVELETGEDLARHVHGLMEIGDADPADDAALMAQAKELVDRTLDDFIQNMPGDRHHLEAVKNSFARVHAILAQGGTVPVREMTRVMGLVSEAVDYGMGGAISGPPKIVKTFPAIRLTPEVRERIKKVGVPLWSIAGGSAVLETLDEDGYDPEPQRFAKGGQVERALKELKEYANSAAPQRGMFSTLDELVQGAPFPRGSVDQWQGYLKPGRMLKREGMEFPLKQEELDYALDPALGAIDQIRGGTGTDVPLGDVDVTREDLLDFMRRSRPTFGVAIGDNQREYTRGPNASEAEDLATDQYMEQLGDTTRARLHGTRYGPDEGHRRLSHETPGSSYQESVTTMQGLDHPQHFERSGLSHSRASSHNLPDGTKLRLVEEIQSDLHEAAAERTLPDDWEQRLSPEDAEEWSFIKRRAVTADSDELADEEERFLERIKKGMPRRGYGPHNDPDRYRFNAPVPDAPFKDPADYGRLELRKQLLQAVNEDQDYLALTRGIDNAERYGMAEVRDGSVFVHDQQKYNGMRHVYDNVYRGELEKLAKRYGAEVTDVPLNVGTETDVRPQLFVNADVEDAGDFITVAADNLSVDDFSAQISQLANVLRQVGDEDAIDELLAHRDDIVESFQARRGDGRAFGGADNWTEDELESLSKLQDEAEGLYQRWEEMTRGRSVDDGVASDKTFPAIRLTPEVRERIKKVGVPLWSLAGGSAVLEALDEDEETPAMAKGGQVRRALKELKTVSGMVLDHPVELGLGAALAASSVPGFVRQRRQSEAMDRAYREAMKERGHAEGGPVEEILDNPDDDPRLLDRMLAALRAQWSDVDPRTGEAGLVFGRNLGLEGQNTDESQRVQLFPGLSYIPQNHGVPGIVYDTISMPGLVDDLAPLLGMEPPGLSEWGPVKRASERMEAIDRSIRRQRGLDHPHGFWENAFEGAGSMLGQLPVPGAPAKTLGRKGLKHLSEAAEFFTPTVTGPHGYWQGALMGGAFGLPETLGRDFAEGSQANYERSLFENPDTYMQDMYDMEGEHDSASALEDNLRDIEAYLRAKQKP